MSHLKYFNVMLIKYDKQFLTLSAFLLFGKSANDLSVQFNAKQSFKSKLKLPSVTYTGVCGFFSVKLATSPIASLAGG